MQLKDMSYIEMRPLFNLITYYSQNFVEEKNPYDHMQIFFSKYIGLPIGLYNIYIQYAFQDE